MCAASKPLRPADWAWLALGAAVAAYEAAATRRDWELLSEACDRYRASRPLVTNTLIAYLAAHLARRIPRPVDPLYLIGTRLRR